jgi:hypothetical protein
MHTFYIYLLAADTLLLRAADLLIGLGRRRGEGRAVGPRALRGRLERGRLLVDLARPLLMLSDYFPTTLLTALASTFSGDSAQRAASQQPSLTTEAEESRLTRRHVLVLLLRPPALEGS